MLTEQGTAFTRRDYFKERFTAAELRAVLASAGLKPSDVLSKRAKAYGDLIGERTVGEEELLELMVQEPTLLRRPLAIRDGRAIIGFDQAALKELGTTAG